MSQYIQELVALWGPAIAAVLSVVTMVLVAIAEIKAKFNQAKDLDDKLVKEVQNLSTELSEVIKENKEIKKANKELKEALTRVRCNKEE